MQFWPKCSSMDNLTLPIRSLLVPWEKHAAEKAFMFLQ